MLEVAGIDEVPKVNTKGICYLMCRSIQGAPGLPQWILVRLASSRFRSSTQRSACVLLRRLSAWEGVLQIFLFLRHDQWTQASTNA